MTKHGRGVWVLLGGAAAWGVLWYPLRLFVAHGLSGLWLTVFLYAGALVLISPVVRTPFARWPRLAALAFLGGVTNIGFVLAVLTDNVLRVTLLFYLSPVWAVLLGRVFLGERLGWRVMTGVMIAVAGMFMILWREAALVIRAADLYALAAGFSFAAANVLIRADRHLTIGAKAQATFFGVVVLGVVVAAFAGIAPPVSSAAVAGLALGAGGLVILAITVAVQYGVTVLPVRQSAVIALVEVLTAAVSQQLWLHQGMTVATVVGGAVLAFGATRVARHEQ
ncbi:MAG: DMT family transporter [Gammaproteobacteria bacterium]|nr:DMT family transporter [Gammaproteobacteria bacterium]